MRTVPTMVEPGHRPGRDRGRNPQMQFRRFAKILATAAAASLCVTGVSLTSGATAQAALTNYLVFQQNTGGHDCYRIPSIVKAGNGDLRAFAEGRTEGAKFCADLGKIDLLMKRSQDGGKTWSAAQTIIEARGDTKGNPTPIAIPGTKRIVLLSTMQCYTNPACGRVPRVSISDDNGTTWTTPKVLTTE